MKYESLRATTKNRFHFFLSFFSRFDFCSMSKRKPSCNAICDDTSAVQKALIFRIQQRSSNSTHSISMKTTRANKKQQQQQQRRIKYYNKNMKKVTVNKMKNINNIRLRSIFH